MSIEWFPGTIEEAIENASPDDRLIITFIDGLDKSSAKLLKYLNEPRTFAKIKENRIKIFKISSNSEKFKKFSTTYKSVPVPSIFFLDQTGKPLGLITSDIISAEALEDKFDRILEKIPPIDSLHSSEKYSTFHLNKKHAKKEEISSDEEDEKEINPYAGKSKLLQENPAKLSERERIRQQIAVDRYELSQRQAYLTGGQDLRVSGVVGPPTNPTPTKSQESKIYDKKVEEPTRSEIANKSTTDPYNNIPQLTNLMIRFNNGETRGQHFTYKTSLGVVKGYIQEVVQRDYGNFEFYVSATSPHRVLVRELDKVSLEDLGLFPVAELVVKVNKQKILITERTQRGEQYREKSVIQKLGGINTIFAVMLWVVISPVLVGTNWCGICNKSNLETPIEDVSGWMYNVLTTLPSNPSNVS